MPTLQTKNKKPRKKKKNYRKLNSQLNVVLGVPEVLACAKRFGDMDPEHFPSVFMKRNSKFLLKKNIVLTIFRK